MCAKIQQYSSREKEEKSNLLSTRYTAIKLYSNKYLKNQLGSGALCEVGFVLLRSDFIDA
jgi:hypothetical protein